MKCVHCGANIPDDQMICPVCGAEVQIVPDYNPLDDVLAREVRGSVEGATRQIRTDDIRRYRREDLTKNINSTRVLSEDEMERIRSNRRKSTNNTERNSAELRRQRQARQQKRLEAAKRKRRRLLLTLAAVVILIGFGIYVAYQNSYTGMLKKGYRAVNEKEYMAAEKYFDRAIIKDKSRPDAYVGLAEIYLDQNDTDGAEDVYLSAIETQPTNEKLYQAAIDFYITYWLRCPNMFVKLLNLNPKREHTKRFRRLRSVRIRKVKSIIRRTEQIRLRRQGKNIKNLSYWKKKEQRRFALLL